MTMLLFSPVKLGYHGSHILPVYHVELSKKDLSIICILLNLMTMTYLSSRVCPVKLGYHDLPILPVYPDLDDPIVLYVCPVDLDDHQLPTLWVCSAKLDDHDCPTSLSN